VTAFGAGNSIFEIIGKSQCSILHKVALESKCTYCYLTSQRAISERDILAKKCYSVIG